MSEAVRVVLTVAVSAVVVLLSTAWRCTWGVDDAPNVDSENERDESCE